MYWHPWITDYYVRLFFANLKKAIMWYVIFRSYYEKWLERFKRPSQWVFYMSVSPICTVSEEMLMTEVHISIIQKAYIRKNCSFAFEIFGCFLKYLIQTRQFQWHLIFWIPRGKTEVFEIGQSPQALALNVRPCLVQFFWRLGKTFVSSACYILEYLKPYLTIRNPCNVYEYKIYKNKPTLLFIVLQNSEICL